MPERNSPWAIPVRFLLILVSTFALLVTGILAVSPVADASSSGYVYPVTWARALGNTADTGFNANSGHIAHCASTRYSFPAGSRNLRFDYQRCVNYQLGTGIWQAVEILWLVDADGFEGSFTPIDVSDMLDYCSNGGAPCGSPPSIWANGWSFTNRCTWSAITAMGGPSIGYGCFGNNRHNAVGAWVQGRVQHAGDSFQLDGDHGRWTPPDSNGPTLQLT